MSKYTSLNKPIGARNKPFGACSKLFGACKTACGALARSFGALTLSLGTLGRSLGTLGRALGALGALALLSAAAHAAPVRDCVMEGTLQRGAAEDQIRVSFHSAKPAEDGASCRIRRNEKLHFKSPAGAIQNAPEGSRVRYRYREDAAGEQVWELQQVTRPAGRRSL